MQSLYYAQALIFHTYIWSDSHRIDQDNKHYMYLAYPMVDSQ